MIFGKDSRIKTRSKATLCNADGNVRFERRYSRSGIPSILSGRPQVVRETAIDVRDEELLDAHPAA